MQETNIQAIVENLFDALSAELPPAHCVRCGCHMMQLPATFHSLGPNGKVWTVALPVCPRCDLKEDTAQFTAQDRPLAS